jgi:hypothetical protein
MNVKTMEGLAGAGTSVSLVSTPMNIAKEAERKGDIDKMKRAMGYAAGMMDEADQYSKKTSEGMKLDAEKAREQEKLRQEALVEARKEEREELEKRLEEGGQEGPKTDSVEISPEGKAQAAGTGGADAAEPVSPDSGSAAPDVTYDSSGVPVEAVQAAGENVDVRV